jgi:hypothetical protein
MKRVRAVSAWCLCAALAAGAIGAGALHQPEGGMNDEAKQEADQMAQMNALRPEHQMLAKMCGTWDVTMKITPMPGAEPIEVKAVATREMILGGKFLQERVRSDGPMPFSSLSIAGFNADAQGGGRFEITRFSSMVHCQMPETGTYDAATSTFTTSGSHDINGMRGTIRNTVKRHGDDAEHCETYLSFEGYSEQFKGMKVDEYHAMTMDYTRRK